MDNRVLLVDDEPNVLRSFQRTLSKRFDLHVAEGGPNALKIIDESPPFAVIVSDMRMPEISGQELLCHVRNKSPETTRIMLTGNSDQETATMAINDCRVFRFISKPCDSDDLGDAIAAGIKKFRRITNERELLEKTLEGTIELMNDVLKMLHPEAFTKSARIRSLAKSVCELLDCENGWQIETAAALSQIGTLAGLSSESASDTELGSSTAYCDIAAQMVSRIPRMESVADMIGFQANSKWESDREAEPNVTAGAQILNMLLSYDLLAEDNTPAASIKRLEQTELFAEKTVWLEALTNAVSKSFQALEVNISDLRSTMVLDDDVHTTSGVLLIKKGCQVTDQLRERLVKYKKSESGVVEPIRVRCID